MYCLVGRSIHWLIDYDIIDHPAKNLQGARCELNLISGSTDFSGCLQKSIFLADGKLKRAITSRNWTPKLRNRMANDIVKDTTIMWWIDGQSQTISCPWNKDTVKYFTSRPFSSKCSRKILNIATFSISYYPVQSSSYDNFNLYQFCWSRLNISSFNSPVPLGPIIICWAAVGCGWGSTSVCLGVTFVCSVPRRLIFITTGPKYQHNCWHSYPQ